MRRALLAAGLLALVSCAGGDKGAAMHSGTYRAGFETQAFWPDDGGGPYWVEGGKAAMGDLESAVRKHNGGSPWGGVRVKVKGTLSKPGRFGHLGAYTHLLRIERILETSPADDGAGARG